MKTSPNKPQKLSHAQKKERATTFFNLLQSSRSKGILASGDKDESLEGFFQWALAHAPMSKAQLFQDLWVLWELGQKRNGYFCEFGATDGLLLSNTYLLEKSWGWTGILAEPNPVYHDALGRQRSCHISHDCVFSDSGKILPFIFATVPYLSRLADTVPEDAQEIQGRREEESRVDVRSITLNDLLDAHDAPRHIDYISIDTEGSEFEILKNFDFSRRSVGMFTVEHNGTETRSQVFNLLRSQGYERRISEFSRWDDWYIHPDAKPSQRLAKKVSGNRPVVAKAAGSDWAGRFREIVSDPLNLLIERVPEAGTIKDGLVVLHNGVRVPQTGPNAYYEGFSDIFVINRGVHEPLEEFAFQEVLKRLPEAPVMLELGAYWGHYSMWLQKTKPDGELHLVEPDGERLEVGKANLAANGFVGRFINKMVGKGAFEVDEYMALDGIEHLHILHSDIQGAEVEMLEGAVGCLAERKVDYLFISTHGQRKHHAVVKFLKKHGYRIELAADDLYQTTSFDGFVLAVNPELPPIFPNWNPLGRVDIMSSDAHALVASLDARLQS